MTAKKHNQKGRGQSGKSGGTMMSMRSGFKSAVGQGKKRKKTKQRSFAEVFFYIFLAALILVLIWQLKQG